MTQTNTEQSSLETPEMSDETVNSLFNEILKLDPKPIEQFVPYNAKQEKELFLKGDVHNPVHLYDRLEKFDFEGNQRKLQELRDKILNHPDMNTKFASAYEQHANTYIKRTQMMQFAHLMNTSEGEERKAYEAQYMAVNIEVYGKPDENIYRNLLAKRIAAVQAKDLTPDAQKLLDETLAMVGNIEVTESYEFTPSKETVEWMHSIVSEEGGLYTGMLNHIPEQQTFTDNEIFDIFTKIVEEEFGESAEGWRVKIEKATSINVKPNEKLIVIPENRQITRDALRRSTVHELGVHMLRAIQGSETDLDPLQTGLDNYHDNEEALGVIMAQALENKYREAGVDHYITAGAAFYDKKDFRDIFELKWRLAVLTGLKDGEELTNEKIVKSREAQYNNTFRSFRGTDTLPWFKDLAYYNGVQDTWRHLEEIRGDDLKFSFVLMGKANAANPDHTRLLYETSSK